MMTLTGRILELKAKGMTHESIARELGYSKSYIDHLSARSTDKPAPKLTTPEIFLLTCHDKMNGYSAERIAQKLSVSKSTIDRTYSQTVRELGLEARTAPRDALLRWTEKLPA